MSKVSSRSENAMLIAVIRLRRRLRKAFLVAKRLNVMVHLSREGQVGYPVEDSSQRSMLFLVKIRMRRKSVPSIDTCAFRLKAIGARIRPLEMRRLSPFKVDTSREFF